MSSALQELCAYRDKPTRFDLAWAEISIKQIEAVNERFQQQRHALKLLAHRAEKANIEEVKSFKDLIPLLFAHTAYKSYPEDWLANQQWARLSKWLNTVSVQAVPSIAGEDISDVDQWVNQLAEAGHYVSCSSGTTGKIAMMNATREDLEWSSADNVNAFTWTTGIKPDKDRALFGFAPVASVARNNALKDALIDAFVDPAIEPFTYPVPEITIGQITGMVQFRKRMARGEALPEEVTAFEQISAERQKIVDEASAVSAKAVIEARGQKLWLSGMWATLYQVAVKVRELGYSASDFNAENSLYVAGGLKGAVLPDDYQSFIYDTFNLKPDKIYQMYSMQELNSCMPKCSHGRYHVPPWVICLLLNESGEELLEIPQSGQQTGRAAFFDLSLEGRWGGVITGDKITVNYERCDCGHASPSIEDNIQRYSDLPDGDKIACSGTIDAYVRGES